MSTDSPHHESSARGSDARMVDRMLFFSDAVFAIVLTIMVLELHPPAVAEHLSPRQATAAIWSGILDMGRVWIAYFVSFALVGLWWTVHMRVTRQLRQFDWPTAVLNFVFLLTVSLTPFASAIMGESIDTPAAWQIYWGVNAGASISLTAMFLVVSRGQGRLVGGMGQREKLARIIQSIGPGVGFSIGVWLATIGEVGLSRFCWVFIIPTTILARTIYRPGKAAPQAEAQAGT